MATATRTADPLVLHLTGRSDHGGGPEHLLQVIQAMPVGRSAFIACPRQGVYWSRYADVLGEGRLLPIPHRRLSLSAILRLAREVRRRQVEVLHSHGLSAGIYARIVGLLTRRPVVHTFHGVALGQGFKQRIYAVVERLLSRGTAVGIAVSAGERSLIEQQYPCHRGRLVVVPNGVDLGLVSAVNTAAEVHAAPPSASPVLRVVGFSRANRQKHPELVADILACCPLALRAQLEVHLFGDGLVDHPPLLAAQAAGLPLVLHPPTDAPQVELARSQLYLSTSRWEGLPLALLEAWRAGTCVLATAVVGNHDVVEHQRNGLLFGCSDAQAGAAALAQLVADHALRARLCTQAARDLQQRFGRELMARRIDRVHRWALGCSVRGPT